MIDRLVLGTVQLGMHYGINNVAGKPDFRSACDIVKTAFDHGITRFDTAQAYGDSEEVLGKIFDALKIGSQVKVYSKLNPGLDLLDEGTVQQSVDDSLRKLKIDQLEGLLLHSEDGMQFWNNGLGDILRGLVSKGKVCFAGASFYAPQKALNALDEDGVDIIQVPANIWDRRFEDAGVFRMAEKLGKKVFVRSVFLQGFLLMDLGSVPERMKVALPYLKILEQMAYDMGLSRHELILGYAVGRWGDASVLLGAESSQQVVDNVRSFSARNELGIDSEVFINIPENILNPALWSKI